MHENYLWKSVGQKGANVPEGRQETVTLRPKCRQVCGQISQLQVEKKCQERTAWPGISGSCIWAEGTCEGRGMYTKAAFLLLCLGLVLFCYGFVPASM